MKTLGNYENGTQEVCLSVKQLGPGTNMSCTHRSWALGFGVLNFDLRTISKEPVQSVHAHMNSGVWDSGVKVWVGS